MIKRLPREIAKHLEGYEIGDQVAILHELRNMDLEIYNLRREIRDLREDFREVKQGIREIRPNPYYQYPQYK